MEQQQSLGQLPVVESLGLQQVGHYGLVVALFKQLLNVFAFVFLAFLAESLAESELLDVGEEFFFEIGGGHVIGRVEEREHVLEHAAGRARRRYELHHRVAFLLIFFPCFYVLVFLLFGGRHDALADGGRALQLEEGETILDLL